MILANQPPAQGRHGPDGFRTTERRRETEWGDEPAKARLPPFFDLCSSRYDLLAPADLRASSSWYVISLPDFARTTGKVVRTMSFPNSKTAT